MSVVLVALNRTREESCTLITSYCGAKCSKKVALLLQPISSPNRLTHLVNFEQRNYSPFYLKHYGKQRRSEKEEVG